MDNSSKKRRLNVDFLEILFLGNLLWAEGPDSQVPKDKDETTKDGSRDLCSSLAHLSRNWLSKKKIDNR